MAVVAANKKSPSPARSPATAGCWRRPPPAGRRCYFEATAGAGLPILGTLRDLVATGDEIVRIDGVLSGTPNAVFSEIGRGAPLSQAVRRAYDQG